MENDKQQLAADFDQYQALSTESDRQGFWNTIENKVYEMTPEQRLSTQANVRRNIDQILARMEAVAQQLTNTEHSVAQ